MSEDKAKIQEAIEEAELVRQKVEKGRGDLSPAYEELEKQISQFEAAGYSIEDVIPPETLTTEPGLGAAIRTEKSGRGFFTTYKRVLRKYLCGSEGRVDSTVEKAISAGTGSAVPAIIGALGISLVAAPIIAPIIGVIVYRGIKRWCSQ